MPRGADQVAPSSLENRISGRQSDVPRLIAVNSASLPLASRRIEALISIVPGSGVNITLGWLQVRP